MNVCYKLTFSCIFLFIPFLHSDSFCNWHSGRRLLIKYCAKTAYQIHVLREDCLSNIAQKTAYQILRKAYLSINTLLPELLFQYRETHSVYHLCVRHR